MSALGPVWEALGQKVAYGEKIALQASGKDGQNDGKVLCAEEGGPTVDGEPFDLTGRAETGPWESWLVLRGR
jgi:hypothetical protein